MTKPILVCMAWRGGERFERCLASIERSLDHFTRVVLSVTSNNDSADVALARAFQERFPHVEVLSTGRELPTMQHQAFWIDHLHRSGVAPEDWIYWLAYDDEVREAGIHAISDAQGNWPLRSGTAYVGPWAMRHEGANELWQGDLAASLEVWTSFPADGPTKLPVMEWIRQQIAQPTYMQMSGSVIPFANFLELRHGKPTKTGPMRIEMATVACSGTLFVEEFADPVSIIYGRSNSDRASYGRQAHSEDWHLAAWLAKYSLRHPSALAAYTRTLATPVRQHATKRLRGKGLPQEEWRVRGLVSP